MTDSESFLLGEHRVEPSSGLVAGPAGSAHLAPKLMQVLLTLAGRPGQVVTREDLLAKVWPQSFVEEGVLTRAVAELRKALQDSPQSPWAIETIPKIGYRLLVAPRPLPASGSAAIPAPEAARRRGSREIAAALFLAAAGLALAAVLRLEPEEPSEALLPLTPVPLNLHAGAYVDPALAPDASRLAYALAGVPEERGLYIMPLPQGEPRRLAVRSGGGDPRAPAWSPDGQTVAFLRVRSDTGCTGLFLVPSRGGSERRLAGCPQRRNEWTLDWSPDGRWLTLAGGNGRSRLYLVEARSGRLQPLPLSQPPLSDLTPRFSPDSRSIAFRRAAEDGAEDLYVVPIEGGEPVRLTFDGRRIRGLAWTPDGTSLLFSSNRRAGLFELWEVPVRGGPPRLLPLAGGGSPDHPTFRRGRLVYERVEIKTELVAVDRTRGSLASRPWLRSPGRDRQPAFSPDGQRVAFASDRSGTFEIWTAGRDGGSLRRLTELGDPTTGWPAWSPDGRRIAFSSSPHGHADLFVTGAGGGPAERLTHDLSADQAPVWSADGQSLYYSSLREGKWQIRRIGLTTRSSEVVLAQGGPRCLLPPEGDWLYFTRDGLPGLWRATPAQGGGSEPEPVARELVPPDWGHWAFSGRDILFVRRSPREGNAIVRLDPATSVRQTLAVFPPGLLSAVAGDVALAASPDGRTVLVTHGELNVGLQLVSPASWPPLA